MARTLTCDCGDVLTADNDEELYHVIRRHDVLIHAGLTGMSDEQIKNLIASKAEEAPVG